MAPFYDANEQFALGNGVEREIKHATALSKAKPPKDKPGEKPDPKLVAKDRAEIHEMHADFAKEMKADGGVHPNKDFKMMKDEPQIIKKVFKEDTQFEHHEIDKSMGKPHHRKPRKQSKLEVQEEKKAAATATQNHKTPPAAQTESHAAKHTSNKKTHKGQRHWEA